MLISVAIVEDNLEIRRNLARFIGEAPGFRCTSLCASYDEALRLIPNNPPDVVLMDIQLPGKSGIECTVALKQMLPDLRVMMLTVYEDNDAIFAALKAGASGYMLKRSAPSRLIEAIKELKQGGAPMTSEIARKVIDSFHVDKPVTHPQDQLTAREEEVLQHLAKGYAPKEISAKMNLSYETVRVYLKHIYEKLHVRSRTEAVLKYLKYSVRTDASAGVAPAPFQPKQNPLFVRAGGLLPVHGQGPHEVGVLQQGVGGDDQDRWSYRGCGRPC